MNSSDPMTMTTSVDSSVDISASQARAALTERLEREVRTFIASNFVFDDRPDALAGEASLTQAGVLDSMGVLELILFIEETYGVSVPDEDTLPENLDSVERIVRYLERRLRDQGRRA